MLVHLALLSASILLGPPPAQRLEISLTPSYAQAPEGRNLSTARYQRLRLATGMAYSADAQHTVHFELPWTFARHESPEGVVYRNGDVGDATFGIVRWLDSKWHVGIRFALPLTTDIDRTVYSASADNVPALDTGRTRTRLGGGFGHRTDRYALDLTLGADIGLDTISIAPTARLSGLLVLLENALEAGAFVDAKWGTEEEDDRWIRLGLLERVGPAIGLSGEVVVSTIFAARNTEAATEASLRLVWRR